MAGSRVVQAARGAVLMSEVLDKSNIDFEIIAFNKDVVIYKEFGQKYSWGVKRNLELLQPATHGNKAGCTHDAGAVHLARKRLEEQKGEKIMIVLCDGDTNNSLCEINPKLKKWVGNKYNWGDFSLTTEVKASEKTISTIGIGINCESVKKYYRENAVITDVKELPRSILKLISKHVIRG
jgi:cobalamin biosynthesis protein CobT